MIGGCQSGFRRVPRGTDDLQADCEAVASCHSGLELFHVEQKHPAHRATPEAVRYSERSISRLPLLTGRNSCVDKRTSRPAGTRTVNPSSIHFSGGNVARETATSKREEKPSSRRALTTLAFPHPISLTAVFRKATRLARGSSKVTWQSGRRSEKGIPGSPPPDPTSNTLESEGQNRERAKLSGRWSPIRSDSERAPVKLTRTFHSSNR
jgi:hypothetical protein